MSHFGFGFFLGFIWCLASCGVGFLIDFYALHGTSTDHDAVVVVVVVVAAKWS